MLRITSGIAKGKKIDTPSIEGFRAVQDKAKLAIFSIIGEKIIDSICLDLFSGSGNFGLEALSRGAKVADFVDSSYESEKVIRKNILNFGFEDKTNVYKQDAIKFVANCPEKYDLIFVDPFYKDTHFRFLFENLQYILNPEGLIIFSHGKQTEVEDCISNADELQIIDTRKYGNAFITFLKLK